MKNINTILNSFNIQNNLNPKFWKESSEGDIKLDPKIRERLMEISNEFIEFLKVDIIVSDIIITGSLSNYNWSKFSDIDLHVVSDFSQFPQKTRNLYEELFKLKKLIFNEKHDITIYGYDVELYVQNESESHFSTGVYSVLNDEWIVKPKKEDFKIDKDLIKSKAKQWMDTIDSVIENAEDESLEDAKKLISKYKEKLKKYRTCGLEKGGEYSDENIVFKILRRNGYIEKLFNFDNKNIDDKLSLNESTLNSPLDVWSVTSSFGRRWGRKHKGIDLKAVSGTEIKSPSNGVVIDSEFKDNSCGGTLYIDHQNGYQTRYCHVKEFKVKKGDIVKTGQIVGLTGGDKNDIGRGNSRGPHLHFEVYKDGKVIDPEDVEFSHLDYSQVEPPSEDIKIIDIINKMKESNTEFKEKTNDVILKTYNESNFLKNLVGLSSKDKTYENMKKYGKIPYDEDVKKIQEALQFLGFSLPKWGIDGLFGPETEIAVKKFESEYGLTQDGKLSGNDLKYLTSVLLLKDFKDVDLGELQVKSDFSKINVGSDKEFYEEILKGIGAPISEENLKFLYAWRQAEGAKAKNNPFNTTMKLKSDPNLTNYNKVGVKSYSTPQHGIEATVKTITNGNYPCLVDGLRNDVGSIKLAECLSTTKWGTGDLALKVVKSDKINPPEIYS